MGNALKHDLLHPNETISAAFTFYIPQDDYDSIEVVVELPTSSIAQRTPEGFIEPAMTVEYEWQEPGLRPILKEVMSDGSKQEAPYQ